MKAHGIILGIEHLMTGLVLTPKDGHAIQFIRESPSCVKAISDEPFYASWGMNPTILMDSTEFEYEYKAPGHGDVEWYAGVVADAMIKAERRLYDMQTYTRKADEFGDPYEGGTGYYARGEPVPFPVAVVNAMRRKHGKDTAKFLAMLRWTGDHWFYNHNKTYVGVEPDGYIHT